MAPPYRVDHVGSLIRPEKLLNVRKVVHNSLDSIAQGTHEQEAEIRAVTQDCVHEVVLQQLQQGVTTITSGEFERTVFWNGFFEGLSGFDVSFIPFATGKWRPGFPINEIIKSMGGTGRVGRIAVDKIKRVRPIYLDSWLMLRSCLPPEQWRHAKINVLTPTWFHEMMETPYTLESGYSDDKQYLTDISNALREEVLELYAHGVRNVQVDDPLMSMFYTESWEPILRQQGTDIEYLIDLYIWTHNNFLKDLPEDLDVYHHMCRGNTPGYPTLVGGFNVLVERIFKETAYKTFYLEWDSPEHGDFTPLRHLPEGKAAMLGLVTTKDPKLEDIGMLKQRVLEAAKVIATAQGKRLEEAIEESLGVSPQCGFSTGSTLPSMTIKDQWKKMDLLQRLAEDLWPAWKNRAINSKL